MTSVAMKQKRKALLEEMKTLHGRADESGKLTSEDQAQWERLDEEVRSLGNAIQRSEMLEEADKRAAEQNSDPAPQDPAPQKREHAEVFDMFMRRGVNGLEEADRGVLFQKRGTNTQITTTDSLGGFLVPETWANQINEELQWFAPILSVANVFTTATGGVFNTPTNNDTTERAVIINQGAADTVKDLTFGNVSMNDYTYSSGLIKVSWEQMNDSAYDLGAFVRKKISERFGRAWSADFTNADGLNKPAGFLPDATEGHVAAATNAITSAEIIDLIHSIDKAYRMSPSFRLVLHDSTVAALRKLTIGSGDARPLWQPSVRDGEPDRIHGVPYIVNNDMPELSGGANSKVIAAGDFSKFNIRLIGGLEMVRLNERYANERSVGFFGYQRVDSKLINANAVKYLALAAS